MVNNNKYLPDFMELNLTAEQCAYAVMFMELYLTAEQCAYALMFM
jgi:hypothetical protein